MVAGEIVTLTDVMYSYLYPSHLHRISFCLSLRTSDSRNRTLSFSCSRRSLAAEARQLLQWDCLPSLLRGCGLKSPSAFVSLQLVQVFMVLLPWGYLNSTTVHAGGPGGKDPGATVATALGGLQRASGGLVAMGLGTRPGHWYLTPAPVTGTAPRLWYQYLVTGISTSSLVPVPRH